ncbi:hypothetical protein [Ferrovibrio sp.]|uniref:hypothetical protein n=1 Tax=Ferrovibrio sp. TaxID=1917215 RepID=UPI00311DE249
MAGGNVHAMAGPPVPDHSDWPEAAAEYPQSQQDGRVTIHNHLKNKRTSSSGKMESPLSAAATS